jgi:Family of unknown function (DUF5677)
VDIEKYYSSSLDEFTVALEMAIATSHATTSLQAGARRFWASILFTRLCTSSISILSLCPASKLNQNGFHWDFGAVASLSRNIFECALNFFYLGMDTITDEEWMARLKVMQLHDCMSRFCMFRDFDPNDEQLKAFEEQANELRSILQTNTFFINLPEPQRNKLLKGKHASILTHDEILQRMGELQSSTRGYYRFLSSHTHSFPLSFYRMAEQDRGRGVKNEAEMAYIGGALEFCANTLKRCTDDMRKLFEDIAEFPNNSFNLDALKRAP